MVFSAAAIATVVWLIGLGHGLTFYYDEWDFVQAAASSSYWHEVIQPHNGHPSMVPYTIYWVLLHTAGLHSYWPYRTALVILDVACGLLLFLLLRRKVHPLAAGAASAVLMLLGPAWQDLLWPFQIGFIGSVAGGLGALVLLDRERRWSDVGAVGCLIVAVGSSGVGVAFVAGIAVELLWRRRDWRRLWVPAVPFALFITWYEVMGDSEVSTLSPSGMVSTAAHSTAATIGAAVGRGTNIGVVLGIVLGVLCIAGFVRHPRHAGRLAMAITGLVAFWILTDVARGASTGTQSRYFYPAAAFVLIAVGELPSLVVGTEPRHGARSIRSWTRTIGWIVACGVVAYGGLAIWWNSGSLVEGGNGLLGVSTKVRAELGAVVLAANALPTDFKPDKTLMPQVAVGPFLRAVIAFGSPGDEIRALHALSPSLRSSIDTMLLRGRPLQVTAADRPLGSGDCTARALGGSSGDVKFALPADGAIVTAPHTASLAVRAAALSESFPAKPQAIITPGSTSLIRWSGPTDRITWHIELAPIPPTLAPGIALICPMT
jgi:hypothetical protein